jgi:farnesyl diphosphate synthase
MQGDFATRWNAAAEATDAALDRLLSSSARDGEFERPGLLLAAMRYAALGPGKRLRPFLLIETARLCGVTGPHVVDTAAAIECVHAYSLAHDDLPAVDNDDLRRGRPTLHLAFDEATAILAGDALLTLAFDILAGLDADAEMRVGLIGILARAAGAGGMVGGQVLDLEQVASADRQRTSRMQMMKTGMLIRCAAEAGTILGKAESEERSALVSYGEKLGVAFQLADDLIDATGSAALAGKSTAKDAGRGKSTLVALLGVDGARRELSAMVEEAEAALAGFGQRADMLRETVRFVGTRDR